MTSVAPGMGFRLPTMVESPGAVGVIILVAPGKPALVIEKPWLTGLIRPP